MNKLKFHNWILKKPSDNLKVAPSPRFSKIPWKGGLREIVVGDKIIVTKNGERGQWLNLFVPYDKKDWQTSIKAISSAWWMADEKYWQLPNTPSNQQYLKRLFGSKVQFNFKTLVESSNSSPPQNFNSAKYLNEQQKVALKLLEERLIMERKANATIKSYLHHLKHFFLYYTKTLPKSISELQIKAYLLNLIKTKGISISTQNQVINAIKAYYERVLKQERKTYYLDRPKKVKQLPPVLSSEEVALILQKVDNIKHKCILLLVYSAGLRLSEVVKLQLQDIDINRMQIFIRGGKGKKDRYTLLSAKLLPYLKRYYEEYQPYHWLFVGQKNGPYSKRSVQKIFSHALLQSGINKKVTLHTLRHSFATHLLENGVNLRYIQELLGHESSRTTEIYTHITRKGLQNIVSPLEDLDF